MRTRSCLLFSILLPAVAPVAAPAAQDRPASILEREVTIPGPVPLPGTLTLPPGKGPFPALIIVHGSGAGDRDQTVGPNKPYRDLAWGLAELGVAVLRYDKRSRVAPMWFAGRPFTVRDETIDDAVSALALLRSQPEVDARRTALIGHSLGGMVAPRIAIADGKLAGVILMAGATRVQLPEQMDRQIAYIISISGADSATVRAQVAPLLPSIERVRSLTPADTADLKPIPGLGGTGPRYWLDLAANDPAVLMRSVPVPVLVLQGERDYQVPVDQMEDWVRTLGPRANLTVKRYPALNHLFMKGEGTPRPAEYALPGRVDPAIMADIATWLRSLPAS